jgi:hypothetical protein
MSNKGRPSITKRQKERARQEQQQDKAARRTQRETERAQKPPSQGAEDPDIAGIVPGPQPKPWED